MMPLWGAQDAAAVTNGEAIGAWAASGVSIDTRSLQEGDLFVALKDVRDGHDFVAQALEKGAAAALVSRRPEGVADDAPLLIVDDVLAALERLGWAGRARSKAKIVAVTGSVGKTSTKEMLRGVLSAQGKTHAAEASYNNHWGVPLTLARLPVDADFAVIEIGMNHPGEIAPLSAMTAPDVAMITTVAAAHLEAFENIDGIAIEKASIFEGLIEGGTAVINADLPTTHILRAKAEAVNARVFEFGESAAAFRLKSVRLSDGLTVGEADVRGAPALFKLGSAGRHFAMNAMGVFAVADALDLDPALTAIALGQWVPPAGRGTRERIGLDVADDRLWLDLFDDAFNANPTSMIAGLEMLAAAAPHDGVGRVAKGRRVAFLGDMLELGDDATDLHVQIASDPSLLALDTVHCVGPLMHHLWTHLPERIKGAWSEDADDMARRARGLVDAGDVVLVKGSKGSRVSVIVDVIRKLGHRKSPDGKGAP